MSHWHIPQKRELPRPWTAEEWQEAQRLKTDGLGADAIAEKLGRSRKAVRAKFQKENLTPEQRRKRTEYERSRRGVEIKTRQIAGITFVVAPDTRAVEAFKERDERLRQSPRDLTSALMGDPLPGYSALERGA